MTDQHLEFLVEEPSMEVFLGVLMLRFLPERTFAFRVFQGKKDMLGKLEGRLKGYAHWPSGYGHIVVVVDRDDDDCHDLKQRLEEAAAQAGLHTRSNQKISWQVINRIAIEELEAWYFGDWEAVRLAYPRVSRTIPNQAKYRDPDAIKGGAWEAFERILQRSGYFRTGLRKREAARAIASHIDPERNRSHSFAKFWDALPESTP